MRGIHWLTDFMENLTDYEKSLVKEESSIVMFTFGDGAYVASLKQVTVPCCIGGMKSTVTTDVVKCNTPLL